MKRLLSIIVSLALVLGLAPGVALGATEEYISTQENAQVVGTGGSNPKPGDADYPWHTGEGGGQVKVSKKLEPTGIENYFDITLTVDAKEKVTDTSTAVVIVMDASNTMNSDHNGKTQGDQGFAGARLGEAKAAANQFIDEFCKGEWTSTLVYAFLARER